MTCAVINVISNWYTAKYLGEVFTAAPMLIIGVAFSFVAVFSCGIIRSFVKSRAWLASSVIWLCCLSPAWLYPGMFAWQQRSERQAEWHSFLTEIVRIPAPEDPTRIDIPASWGTVSIGRMYYIRTNPTMIASILADGRFKQIDLQNSKNIPETADPALAAFGSNAHLYLLDNHKDEIISMITNSERTSAFFRLEEFPSGEPGATRENRN